MDSIGRLLIGLGVLLVLAGGLVLLLGRAGIDLGALPGDFSWTSEDGSTRVFAPIATMLLVSVLLTILVNVLLRLFR